MAKLKAPLMSLGASGALGKALVFFPWKGLDVVREYVIPTNPRSTKQTAQRNLLADAVEEFHAAAYDEDDMIAWALFASTFPTPRTGFNAMTREHILQALGTGTWIRMHDVTVEELALGGATVTVLTPELVTTSIHCQYGYSKSSQPEYVAATTADGTTTTFTIPNLIEGKEVYLYIRGRGIIWKGKNYFQGRTGIYHYTAEA
ncbi:hypothetical protein ES705_27829 [subsurface metagenome]